MIFVALLLTLHLANEYRLCTIFILKCFTGSICLTKDIISWSFCFFSPLLICCIVIICRWWICCNSCEQWKRVSCKTYVGYWLDVQEILSTKIICEIQNSPYAWESCRCALSIGKDCTFQSEFFFFFFKIGILYQKSHLDCFYVLQH